MDFTVYTMGDMPIFLSVLNAMVSVFNSSMFDPTQGAGVYVVSIMLGALFMILSFITTGRMNAMALIVAFIIFWGGIVPRTRLQVEDIYSGQVAAVDNVPMAIALPAALSATLSNAITSTVETAFQSVSGSYLSLSSEGFANPLRTLMKLRDPILMEQSFPYLSASLREFVTYCAPTDVGFSVRNMEQASDVIGYLTTLNVSGVMTYWNSANPNGVGISCTQGQKNLITDTTFTPGSPGPVETALDRMLSAPTDGNFSQNPNSTGNTSTGVVNAWTGVTGKLAGIGQTAQQYILNSISYMPLTQGVDCLNNPTGSNMSTCLSDIIQRQALEQQQVDQTAAASIFAHTAIPAMNILLALFYGFSPIILAVALFAGVHALRIMAGFMMFGAWTQSWMPIAAVINYMIQLQVQYGFSGMPTTGVTMDMYNPFYTALAMKIGMASNLLAMTPMISFALLSGSVYSLSSLASSMNGKDYVDEKLAAPSALQNDAAVHVGADTSVNGRTGNRFNGLMKNDLFNPENNITASSAENAAANSAMQSIHSAVASASHSIQNGLANSHSKFASYSEGSKDEHVIGEAFSHGQDVVTSAMNLVGNLKNNQASQAKKNQLSTQLGVGLNNAFGGPKFNASEAVSVESALTELAQVSTGSDKSQAEKLLDSWKTNVTHNKALSSAYERATQNGVQLSDNETLAKQNQEVDNALQSYSMVAGWSSSAGADARLPVHGLATEFRGLGYDAAGISNLALADNPSIDRSALSSSFAQEQKLLEMNGVRDDNWAMLNALQDQGVNLPYFAAQHGAFAGANSMVGTTRRAGGAMASVGESASAAGARASAGGIEPSDGFTQQSNALRHQSVGNGGGGYFSGQGGQGGYRPISAADTEAFKGGAVHKGQPYARLEPDGNYKVQNANKDGIVGDAVKFDLTKKGGGNIIFENGGAAMAYEMHQQEARVKMQAHDIDELSNR